MEGEPDEETNDVSGEVIGAAIEVHRELGPGLLENAYQEALVQELQERDIDARTEVDLPLRDKGSPPDARYRIDLLVEDTIVVEIKAVEDIAPVHKRQILTYLELSQRPVGLLVNFQQAKLTDGVNRFLR